MDKTLEGLNTLQSLGFEWPSPAYIFGAIVFGLVGFAAWRYGKKTGRPTTKWIGVALMLYPYVVTGTAWMYAVGVALCVALWVWR
jgi:hypothetical protein